MKTAILLAGWLALAATMPGCKGSTAVTAPTALTTRNDSLSTNPPSPDVPVKLPDDVLPPPPPGHGRATPQGG